MSANPHTHPIAYGLQQLQPLVLGATATPEDAELLQRAFYAGAWLTYSLCKLSSLGDGLGSLMLMQAMCDELEAFANLADSLVPPVPTPGGA